MNTTHDLDAPGEIEPVDLDEVLARFHPNQDAIDNPQAIAAIRTRRLYAQLPWWIRWRTPTPPGWRDTATGPIH